MTGRVHTTTPESVPGEASSSVSTRWQRVAGSLSRRTLTSLVVSIPTSTWPLRIEGAAAWVWEALDTPRDIDSIVTEMTLDGELADAAGDVVRTLRTLEAVGLVECV